VYLELANRQMAPLYKIGTGMHYSVVREFLVMKCWEWRGAGASVQRGVGRHKKKELFVFVFPGITSSRTRNPPVICSKLPAQGLGSHRSRDFPPGITIS
jgi:hypothetical protein